jgi:hypothetical protein
MPFAAGVADVGLQARPARQRLPAVANPFTKATASGTVRSLSGLATPPGSTSSQKLHLFASPPRDGIAIDRQHGQGDHK